uniref:CCHC-type domain-containing protein n=1 Tax=Cacopsylla melanoneura TaxID=428564 RepID=A0A8D8RUR5_9HEMI
MCRVKPKVNVLMCYNCLEMGHHSDICRAAKHEKKCLNCTQIGHISKDCSKRSYCATCDREGHRTDSYICPAHKRRVQEETSRILREVRKENRNDEQDEDTDMTNALGGGNNMRLND